MIRHESTLLRVSGIKLKISRSFFSVVMPLFVFLIVGCADDGSHTTFSAFSSGTPGGNFCNGRAAFSRDGEYFYNEHCGRGFNIAIIDPDNATILNEGVRFDTWNMSTSSGSNMYEMIDFIESIPDGQMIMMAVGDDAGLNSLPWSIEGIALLEALGSTMIRDYGFRDSWAFIAVKGRGIAIAEAFAEDSSVTVKVKL